MKKTITRLTILFLGLFLLNISGAQEAGEYYQAGILVQEAVKPANEASQNSFVQGIPSRNQSFTNRVFTEINFDDMFGVPTGFSAVYPLNYEYSGYGITFWGPTPDDGGAVLDEGSNFGVTGYSAPNFLAFNTGSTLANGGTPQGPEDIYFDPPVAYVEILAGSANAGTIEMFAYDELDNLLDFDQLTGASNLQLISVAGERIAKVTIQFSGNVLVLDNLVFNTYLPPDDLEMDYFPGSQMAEFEWKYATMNGIDEEFIYDANNWIPVTGDWYIDPGEYVAENIDYQTASSFYNYNFSGFDMEVKMKKNTGNECNVGIYFHGDPSNINNNGGWMNGYHLIICSDGRYNIVLFENGSPTFIQNITISPNLNTGLNNYNTVRIARENGYIEVYFNGIYENTWYDDTYNSGKIGLKLYDPSAGGGLGFFDFVKISPVTDGFAFQPVNQPEYRKYFAETGECANCSTCNDENYTLKLAPNPPESQFTFHNDRVFQDFNFYMNGNVIDQPNVPNHSLNLTDFMLYNFYVSAQYDEGESNPTNNEMLWLIDNPLYSQFPANPSEYWNAYTSDANATEAYLVYDNFTSTNVIRGIEFLGINLENDGTWHVCDGEDPMDFIIKFYQDDAGMPGSEVASYNATLERIETNIYYGLGSMQIPLYHYRYYFPTPVDLSEGWVSVQGNSLSSPDCWYLWLSSPEGDGLAYQWDGFDMNPIDDISFAILGESSVSIEEVMQNSINIYPNPATDHLYIESELNTAEVTIYNHFGQEVYRIEHPGNILEINTSTFANGVYLVRLSTDKGSVTRKVIVQ